MAAKLKYPGLRPKGRIQSLLAAKHQMQEVLARSVPDRLLFATVEAVMCLSRADAAAQVLSPQVRQWTEWTLRSLRRRRWKFNAVLLLRGRRSLKGA
jgi:hypothetical protein